MCVCISRYSPFFPVSPHRMRLCPDTYIHVCICMHLFNSLPLAFALFKPTPPSTPTSISFSEQPVPNIHVYIKHWHINTQIYIYAHTYHVKIYIYMHILMMCVCAYIHICIYVCAYIHICIYIFNMCVCIHIYMYVYIYTCICIFTQVDAAATTGYENIA